MFAGTDWSARSDEDVLYSKIAITMEIYTEVVSPATREALAKLGERLGP
ncbi:MAG TPA: hypothetical protein VF060_01325 [Trebonia sp.]